MAKKKSIKRKSGFITRIVLILNVIAVIAIFFSYLSLFISPEGNWILPFFGLIYPYLLVINLLFILWWLAVKRLYALLSLMAMLIGWNIIWRTIQFEISTDPLPPGRSLKIMTYNVRNLSNNNQFVPDLHVRENIVKLLRENKPDILCLQEFESTGSEPVTFIDSLSRALGLPYYKYTRYNEKKSKRLDAIITYSRFPILNSYSIKKDVLHNYCLINDLDIWGDTVRLYNIHLESVRFKHEDYSFINDLDLQFEEDENIKEGSKRVFNKLRSAFLIRSSQVKNLRNSLKSSPYPVIICGDFNDTPCSYSYQVLSRGKRDAFMESGSGLGNTYAGTLPSLRIDYILYDKRLQAFGYNTGQHKLSDHYPVVATLGFRKPR